MTRWTSTSVSLVWIALGVACGGEIAPTGTDPQPPSANSGPSNAPSGNGLAAVFGAAGQGTAAIDAGAVVGGQAPPPGVAGGSGGQPGGIGSFGTGSSAAAPAGPPPKSQVSLVTLAPGQTCPWGMAIDATSVYWTTCGDPTGGAVLRVPKAGGPVETLATEIGYRASRSTGATSTGSPERPMRRAARS